MDIPAEIRDARWAYVGLQQPCGCCVAASLDTPSYAKETAKFVAGLIRDGLVVERWPVDDVRLKLRKCTHKTKPAEPDLFTVQP